MANFKKIMALCLAGKSYFQIVAALECSRRDISWVPTIIREHNINQDRFDSLSP